MKQEPPDLELAHEIADRGDAAIPVLIEKLKTARDEMDQEDLIRVFEVMSVRGNLRGRTDIVSHKANIVEDMKLAPIKENTQESLERIRINSGVKPVTYAQ